MTDAQSPSFQLSTLLTDSADQFRSTSESFSFALDLRFGVNDAFLADDESDQFSLDLRLNDERLLPIARSASDFFPLDTRIFAPPPEFVSIRITDFFVLDTRAFVENRPLGPAIAAEGSSWTLLAPVAGPGPFAFQWFRNGLPIPGQTGEALTIPSVAQENAGDYFVIIDAPEGRRATESVPLAVLLPPRVEQGPASQIIRAGAPNRLILEAVASGAPPLSYQWLRNGAELPNATGPQLIIDSPAVAQSGSYAIRVSNPVASSTSDPATVTILENLRVTNPPRPANATLGERVVLSVSVLGAGPFTYQWRLNGRNIPGANADTYVIDSLSVYYAGQYTVAITDLAGAVTSDPAEITISNIQRIAPADNFANAFSLPTPSGSVRASNPGATREPSEPDHAGKPGQHSIWFAFTAPAKGILVVHTHGSSFDTLLAVYSGATLAELSAEISNDDDGGLATSAAAANVHAGQRYFIAIDGLADASGEIVFSWEFRPDFPHAPRFRSQPQPVTSTLGSRVTLSVVADNVISYQWRLDGSPLPGQNSPELIIPNLQLADLGSYDVVVTGADSFATNSPVEVQIGSDTQVLAVDKLFDRIITLPNAAPAPPRAAAGRPGPRAHAGFGSAPSARGIVGVPGIHEDSTIGATRDPGEPNHAGEAGGASTWFVIVADAPGILEVTTAGSDFDTVLALYTGPELVLAYSQLTPVAANNDASPNTTASRVTVPASAGQYFYCAVDGIRGATGRARFNYRLGLPPAIAEQPTSQTILARAPVTLRVRANNTTDADATYQWFHNGAPLGVTTPDLHIPDTQPLHAGQYTALVETFAGRATSQPATITIAPAQPLQFTAQPALNGNQLRLQIRGGSALPIRLQTSPNLLDWTDLPLPITDNHIDLPLPADTLPAFYRLLQ